MQYFVVMIDYGRRGREAVVDPEVTRREVVSRVASGEYGNISFIHEIEGSTVEDITAEILAEAAVPEIAPTLKPICRRAGSIICAICASMKGRERGFGPFAASGRIRFGLPPPHSLEITSFSDIEAAVAATMIAATANRPTT